MVAMATQTPRGLFISFEGVDGAGKTTLTQALKGEKVHYHKRLAV